MQYIGGTKMAVNIGFKDYETYQECGKRGVVDLSNHVLIPLKYSEINLLENGLYAVEFKKNGELLIHPKR